MSLLLERLEDPYISSSIFPLFIVFIILLMMGSLILWQLWLIKHKKKNKQPEVSRLEIKEVHSHFTCATHEEQIKELKAKILILENEKTQLSQKLSELQSKLGILVEERNWDQTLVEQARDREKKSLQRTSLLELQLQKLISEMEVAVKENKRTHPAINPELEESIKKLENLIAKTHENVDQYLMAYQKTKR